MGRNSSLHFEMPSEIAMNRLVSIIWLIAGLTAIVLTLVGLRTGSILGGITLALILVAVLITAAMWIGEFTDPGSKIVSFAIALGASIGCLVLQILVAPKLLTLGDVGNSQMILGTAVGLYGFPLSWGAGFAAHYLSRAILGEAYNEYLFVHHGAVSVISFDWLLYSIMGSIQWLVIVPWARKRFQRRANRCRTTKNS